MDNLWRHTRERSELVVLVPPVLSQVSGLLYETVAATSLTGVEVLRYDPSKITK